MANEVTYKVRMGIVVEFKVTTNNPDMVLPLANGQVREAIEQNIPEGMLFQVFVTEVEGHKVKNDYA